MIRTRDLLNMKQGSYYYAVTFCMSGKHYVIFSFQVNSTTEHCYKQRRTQPTYAPSGIRTHESSIQAGQDRVHWVRHLLIYDVCCSEPKQVPRQWRLLLIHLLVLPKE